LLFTRVGATVTKLADIARQSRPGNLDSLLRSWDSLFARKISLFESAGNSIPTPEILSGISAETGISTRGVRGVPCTFPMDQGTDRRDEFALDSPHRHSVCCCRDCLAPSIEIGATQPVRADFRGLAIPESTGDRDRRATYGDSRQEFSGADFGG
jgi:hypothetical protein